MMDTLVHRGPDDSGFFVKENVALGHRRLSIIDLKTGHQPMFNEDASIALIFNGEIYNFQDIKEPLMKKGHIFKTHSDSEVIVHAYEEYGEDCVKKFNGMFAFALWDSKKRSLFLARDRFGKKPLYYGVFDNNFIFGSELKALLKHPSTRREIERSSLSKFFAYEYVPSPGSIFKGIYKLEAGNRLTLKGCEYRTSQYWDLGFERHDHFELNSGKEKLAGLLKDSVKRRLISDVPLGVFLSGGIDSSAVVAMMAELMRPKDIKTFSIGFKEKSFDESSDARRVAEYFGTDHHEEILGPDTMLGVLPNILDTLDEPFADSSIIPTYLVSKFTRRHVTVALGGDGGDELFAGYPSFLAHRLNSYFSCVPDAVKKFSARALAAMVPISNNYMSLNFKARRFFRGLDFPDEIRHQVWIGSFIPEEQRRLFLPGQGLDADPKRIYDITGKFYQKAKKATSLDRAMYLYIKTYMTDDILAKVDRASMACSLEVRAPFLDTEFAEYAASIPDRFKLKGLGTKWILKEILKSKLPEGTISKSKQGFAVPVGKWLREDLKDLLFQALDEKKIRREGIFDYAYIKELLKRYLDNKSDLRKEIWSLFVFEMWYDRWMK
jgi:asparagine synthase (glutamine-hydrolysing)